MEHVLPLAAFLWLQVLAVAGLPDEPTAPGRMAASAAPHADTASAIARAPPAEQVGRSIRGAVNSARGRRGMAASSALPAASGGAAARSPANPAPGSPSLILLAVVAVAVAQKQQVLTPLSGRVLSILLGTGGSTDPLVASVIEHQAAPEV